MRRLVAVALVAAVAASALPLVRAGSGCRVEPPPSPDGGRTWSGPVPDNASGGRVDVDVELATVHVTTWDRQRYEVRAPLGSYVDGGVQDGAFNLTVDARAFRSVLPSAAGPTDDRVVEVRVPDLGYDRVDVDGAGTQGSNPVVVTDVNATRIEVAGRGVPVAVASLESERVSVGAQDGRVEARNVSAGLLDVDAIGGGVCVADFDGGRLDVVAQNGRVDGTQIAARDVDVDADDGDVDLDVTPKGTGNVTLSSNGGAVELNLPVSAERGYDVRVESVAGRVRADVPGTRVLDRGRGYVHLQTRDFANRTDRTHVNVSSASGGAAVQGHGSLQAPAGGQPEAVPATQAGLLAAIAAALYLLWSRLDVGLSGLYSRIGRDDVLDDDTRRAIRDLVDEEPGIHFRAIQRRLDIGRGILDHHLGKLVDTGVLACTTSQGYRCYFVKGAVDRRVMEAAGRLRSEVARRLMGALQARSGASVTQLADAADVPSSTASYHLEGLCEEGLVDKERDGPGLAVELTELGRRALEELGLDGPAGSGRSRTT